MSSKYKSFILTESSGIYEFTIYENNSTIGKSNYLNIALNKLLFIVRKNLCLLHKNNITLNTRFDNNSFIKINILTSHTNTKLEVEKIEFDLEQCKFVSNSMNDFNTNLDDFNISILNDIISLKSTLYQTVEPIIKPQVTTNKPQVTSIKPQITPVKHETLLAKLEVVPTKSEAPPITTTKPQITIIKPPTTEKETKPTDPLDSDSDDDIPDEAITPEALELLETDLRKLEELKEEGLKKIQEVKEHQKKESDKYENVLFELHDKKKQERMRKEKEQQNRKVFEYDKKIYAEMKKEIEKPLHIRKFDENNIPILFRPKYPIFKFMEQESKFGNEKEFELYSELHDAIYNKPEETNSNSNLDNEIYIPHNIHYLNDTEKEKFFNLVNNNKYPSLDSLLIEQEKLQKPTF